MEVYLLWTCLKAFSGRLIDVCLVPSRNKHRLGKVYTVQEGIVHKLLPVYASLRRGIRVYLLGPRYLEGIPGHPELVVYLSWPGSSIEPVIYRRENMVSKTLFSSKSDEWGTPEDLFNEYDKKFNFNLDPCGHPNRFLKEDMVTITLSGAYCEGKLFNKSVTNGLNISWEDCRVFVNPPYTKKKGEIPQIDQWVKKVFEEMNRAEVIVLLIPARTDTKYFHNWIYGIADITFLKGRQSFFDLINNTNGGKSTFPAMICVYDQITAILHDGGK